MITEVRARWVHGAIWNLMVGNESVAEIWETIRPDSRYAARMPGVAPETFRTLREAKAFVVAELRK